MLFIIPIEESLEERKLSKLLSEFLALMPLPIQFINLEEEPILEDKTLVATKTITQLISNLVDFKELHKSLLVKEEPMINISNSMEVIPITDKIMHKKE